MKALIYSILFFALISTSGLTGQVDTLSYSIGVSVGSKLLSDGARDLDYDSFIKGMRDLMDQNPTLITKAYSDSLNYEYFQKQREIKTNMEKEEGLKFLAENAKKPEVKTTESGLQYEVITQGTGTESPTATSTVTVHYVGQLITGEMFDSSVDRGEPATFPLNRVISGWTEGVQLMTEGSKYRFFIPSELGYGARGAGAVIPPHSTLIFDIELLSIK